VSLSLKQQSSTAWSLHGDVNVNTITAIIAPGCEMINSAPTGETLHLDLSGVTQADSASVALLIDWLRLAKKQGKTLHFANLPEKMKDIIKVSNLEGILA
jgi:phospholipid transport system transporter-binding protein